MNKSITIVAVGIIGVVFTDSVHAECAGEILSNTVLLRQEGSETFVNGVVISPEGLVLTVTSLLYPPNHAGDPDSSIWQTYRSGQQPLGIQVWAEPKEGQEVDQQMFSVAGDIVGFDAWHDLLLLKIPAGNLSGIRPISLALGLDEGNAELCFASFFEDSGTVKTRSGFVKMGDASSDLGYWRSLGSLEEIAAEERGAGVYVIEGENVSLYGILTHDHFGRQGVGILTVQYANSLVSHLMYPTMSQMAATETKLVANMDTKLEAMRERIRHLRVRPFDWTYLDKASDTGSLEDLSRDPKLRMVFEHPKIDSDIEVKDAVASWHIYGIRRSETAVTDLQLPSVSKRITSNNIQEDNRFELDMEEILSYLINADAASIEKVEVKITTKYAIDGGEVTREWDSGNILEHQ